MMDNCEGYAPGWDDDALTMMGRRTADERATFASRLLPDAGTVIDVGCGPGTITVGLARQASPGTAVLGVDRASSQVELAGDTARAAGVANARFETGSAYELPAADHSIDVIFAHAVFEHLRDPVRALVEFRRVLRHGGALALASSDWSGARITPGGTEVEQALQGHYLLRRNAGGDPFAGGMLADLARHTGYVEVREHHVDRVDMDYDELARYIGTRIEAALNQGAYEPAQRDELQQAAAAARQWSDGTGDFVQRWVELTARTPRSRCSLLRSATSMVQRGSNVVVTEKDGFDRSIGTDLPAGDGREHAELEQTLVSTTPGQSSCRISCSSAPDNPCAPSSWPGCTRTNTPPDPLHGPHHW